MKKKQIEMFTIYKSPSDYPNQFVIKKWIVKNAKPYQDSNYIFLSDNLKECRNEMERKGLLNLGKDKNDDEVIVETWI